MRGLTRLAKELGLSTATVSRALNNMPGVHKKTRQRVHDAALRIGYEPNQAARTLALGRTKSIGFMIDLDPDSASGGDNFFMGVFDGVQSVLEPEGLDLLVLPCPKRQDRFAHLDRVVARRVVDGMIISGTEKVDSRIDLLKSSNMPFVAFGRTDSPHEYSWVDLDFEGVARAAVDRLVAQGHSRIAITVPFGDLNFGAVFHNAYRKALLKHGIRYEPELVFQTGLGEEDGYLLTDALVKARATAIILIFEVAAVGIYRRLDEMGLRPGRDLSIIGFRDEVSVRYLSPRLTRFNLSVFDVGVALAQTMLSQIASKKGERTPTAQITIPLTPVDGKSDGPPSRAKGKRSATAPPIQA
jgi:DNA-binding LacI/PurR family transcriptional regulator